MAIRALSRWLHGFAALCGLSLAALPAPDALNEAMYARFALALTHAGDRDEPAEFLVLANPGIGLDPAALKSPSYEISLLLDEVPMTTRSYQPSGNQYSRIYRRILDVAQVTRYQASASRDAALKARRLLFDRSRPGRVTPEYGEYLRYRAEHDSTLDARSLALEENRAGGKPVPPGLNQAIESARKRWESLGYKVPVEKAMEALRRAYESNAQVLFQGLRGEFLNAQMKGRSADAWLPVIAYPPVEQWMTGTGWHPMSFRQADLLQKLPLDAALPPGGARLEPKSQAAWNRNMVLNLEVKRIAISRPWMGEALFSARSWRLPGGPFARVSSGNPADKDPGPMPILVTGLLLARKLTLTGYPAEGGGLGSGKVPTRLGPFDLSGTRSGLPDQARHLIRSAQGIAVSVPDPQIIAFFCKTIPLSPNPDPQLFR